MLKYLEITKTTQPKAGEPVESIEMFSADDVVYCTTFDDSVRIYLKGVNSYIRIQYMADRDRETGTEAVDLVKAVNEALISAAETTWTRATSKIKIRPGMTVTTVDLVQVVPAA